MIVSSYQYSPNILGEYRVMIIEELDYLYSYEYYELAVMNGTMSLYTPYTDREVYAVI